VLVGRCDARARERGFAAAASSFAAAAFSASSASLAKRSERRRIVLAACAWRASASGLTNFAELFFAIVKYRCRCSGCATCQKKNFTDRNRLSRRYAGIVCYLADSLGRRRISDMLSAAHDYTRQTNSRPPDIGVKLLVSRLRISRADLFAKTSSAFDLGGFRSCRSTLCPTTRFLVTVS